MAEPRTPPTLEASEAARQLAANRRPVAKICPICGTEFETIGRGLYDREECRYRATYERRKAARTVARAARNAAKAAGAEVAA